jgi:hypothetical protein
VDEDCDGSDFIGSTVAVANGSHGEVQPSVAHGSGKYLVVWTDGREADRSQIFGRFVDDTGAVMGGEFLIRACTLKRGAFVAEVVPAPQVASDGTDFLVVWQEYFDLGTGDGNVAELYAQRVASDGSLVGSYLDLTGTPAEWERDATVSYGAGTYMVGWSRTGSGWAYDGLIRVRTVASDGTLGTMQEIDTATGRYPVLASNDTNFLITYSTVPDTARVTQGRLLRSDGTPARTAVQVGDFASDADRGVATDGTDYMLFYGTRDIRGLRIDSFGDPVGTPFLVSGAFGNQSDARAALVGGGFTVLFEDDRWGRQVVYSQRVSTSGEPFSTDVFRNAPIYAGPGDAVGPKVASAGSSALLVFQSAADIHATRIAP